MLLLILIVPVAFADQTIAPQYYGNNFGTNQYYAVVFDGEGEAEVAAKLVFQNVGQDLINDISFEIPGKNVRIISAVQEYQSYGKQCGYWRDECSKSSQDTCLEYKRVCDNWMMQPQYPMKYSVLTLSQEKLSNSVKVKAILANKVQSQETTTVIVYYKAMGYATSSLGVYNFDFETIKSSFDVKNVRVSISTQEDLYLKGGGAKVDYQLNSGFSAMSKANDGVQSESMQQFSNSIQYQPGYVKETSGLDPWESFKVSGKYSSSWFLMNMMNLLIWAIVIIVAIFGLRWFLKRRTKRPTDKGLHFRMAGIAFITAIVLSALWYLVLLLFDNLHSFAYDDLVLPFLVLLAGVVMISSFIGPSVYVGMNHGAKYGFITFAYTLGFLVVLAVITLTLLVALRPSVIYY